MALDQKTQHLDELKQAFGSDGTASMCVIGIGGGGGNAIAHMATKPITNVKFYAANTDIQALNTVGANSDIELIPIGCETTGGIGSGGEPSEGRKAAIESSDQLQEIVSKYDIIFLTAGLGGGTGTGGLPVVCDIASSLNKLVIAVVTTPFSFEGNRRKQFAHGVIEELEQFADLLIVVPNDKLLTTSQKDQSLLEALAMSNEVLDQAVRGISTLIMEPGLINVDVADILSITRDMGRGIMGTAVASGELRAKNAITEALESPLLSDTRIDKAKGIIVNISSDLNLKLSELEVIGTHLSQYMTEDTKVVMGTSIDHDAGEDLRVTVVVTGAHIDTPDTTMQRNASPMAKINDNRVEKEETKTAGLDAFRNNMLKRKK